MDIKSLSIIELKQLLSRVNQDLAAIKRADKAAANKRALLDNEYLVANNIAKSFTGKQYNQPIQNAKIMADIQIQQDILDYLNNGGKISYCGTSNRLSTKAVKGAKSGMKLYRAGFIR